MKRDHNFLRRRLHTLKARPLSPSDGPGYLYDFFETPYEVKVGRTINVARRQVQWDIDCWNPNREWEKPIWCPYTHRAGELGIEYIRFSLTDNRGDCTHPPGDALLG